MREAPRLDLDVQRGPGDLIRATLVLFARHAPLFVPMTLLVVAPVTIAVDGVWGGGLADGGDADVPAAALATTTILGFLIPVLVTALHVVAVRDLAEGRAPTVREALRSAAPRFPRAIAAVVVYSLLMVGGMILLVIPGVWVLVAGYFAPQAAVMEGEGPVGAFRRSSTLVRDRWWRTAGTLLLGWLLLMIVSFPAGLAIGSVDAGVLYIALYTLLQVLSLSLSALFGTLMYFSLRAQEERPLGPAPVGTFLPPISPTPADRSPVDP